MLAFSDKFLKKILFLIVCFACGAFIGNLLVHLIPEIFHLDFWGHHHHHETESLSITTSICLLISGFLAFMLLHLALKKHHKKHCADVQHCHYNKKTLGLMNLYSDALHNFTDGLLIASSFVVSKEVGMATTLAILAHEIPQEISDFAILLHAGYSKSKALLYNVLSSLTIILAVILFAIVGKYIPNMESYLTPVVAGTFLYYICFNLLPEIIENTNKKNIFLNILIILTGFFLIFCLYK
jgi:zinc and cadmium transporter